MGFLSSLFPAPRKKSIEIRVVYRAKTKGHIHEVMYYHDDDDPMKPVIEQDGLLFFPHSFQELREYDSEPSYWGEVEYFDYTERKFNPDHVIMKKAMARVLKDQESTIYSFDRV